jgi:hypothetical protein
MKIAKKKYLKSLPKSLTLRSRTLSGQWILKKKYITEQRQWIWKTIFMDKDSIKLVRGIHEN